MLTFGPATRIASLFDKHGNVVRGLLALFVALFGVWLYAGYVDAIYPLSTWLFWPLASVWGYTALLSLAWLSMGHLLLTRVLGLRSQSALETVAFSVPLGVAAFTLSMYAAGSVGLFQPWFALLLAAVFVLSGAVPLLSLRRLWQRDRANAGQSGSFAVSVQAIGVLCLGLMYLQLMTPEALNYDSTWYHLTVAQDYAREGRIVAFPGDYMKNMPQLTGIVNTWSFLVPGLSMPLRWMLLLHVEFSFFLWTLVSVNAVVRWMVESDRRARAAWVTFFLFPGIFVYDSNIGGSADHVIAFFSLPLLLALGRFLVGFEVRWGVLFGVLGGISLLTKFQAVYLLTASGIILGLAWAWRALKWWQSRRAGDAAGAARLARSLWLPPLAIAASAALCAAPNFLRNAIFYGNPFYPFMQDVFTHSHPQVPNGAFLVENVLKDNSWRPRGTFFEKLRRALELFCTFSFKPHYSFTRNVPAFGSLFTLLFPMLLLIRGRRHVLLGAALGGSAILLWAMTFLVDRNLQVFAPVLVATTGALIVRTWELGAWARVGLVPLVLFQAIWGSDALIYSGHERLRDSIELLRSGFEGRAETRFDRYRREYVALGEAVPKDALLVVHRSHVTLGINRRILLDWSGFQGIISYDELRTPRELYYYFKRLGVTHIVDASGSQPVSSKQQAVLFDVFFSQYAVRVGSFGGYQLAEMPRRAPPKEAPYRIITLGLRGYTDGLYPIEKLSTCEELPGPLQVFAEPDVPAPKDTAGWAALAEQSDGVLVAHGAELPPALAEAISPRSQRQQSVGGNVTLHVLKPHAAE